jgi:hypothetical protein
MWYRIEEKTMQRQETSPEGVNDERENQRGPRRRFFETRYWLRDLILSILLAFIVIVFLYQPVQVEGMGPLWRNPTSHRITWITKVARPYTSSPTTTMFWATIEIHPTTAESGEPSIANTFTEKPSSCIGRSANLDRWSEKQLTVNS